MNEVVETITITPPDVEKSIREALAAGHRKVDAWTVQHTKVIEKIGKDRLRQLDQAAAALSGGLSNEPPSKRGGKRKRQSGRSKKSTPTQVETRRQAVYKYLVEQGTPKACSEIARSLNLSHSKTLRALTRLIDDKMVLRTGANSTIKYEVKSGVPARVEQGRRSSATAVDPIGDRLRRSIERRGIATADELAREFRLPFDQVQRGCGALIREDAIALTVYEGRRVYTPVKAAA